MDRYSAAADSESDQYADFAVARSVEQGLDHLMLGRGRVGVDSGFWVREAGSSLGLAVSFLEVGRISRVRGLSGVKCSSFTVQG